MMSSNSPSLQPQTTGASLPPHDDASATSLTPGAGDSTVQLAPDNQPSIDSPRNSLLPAEEAVPLQSAKEDTAITPVTSTSGSATAEAPLETKTHGSPSSITASIPTLSLTLLMISGIRHQFIMDQPYLDRHAVKTSTGKDPLGDPFEMSVRQLKECIWKDWKEEWDQRPASAHFIRLIHFGRMLEDKTHVKDCRFNKDSPNVVHMNIRPPEVGDDDMTQRSTKGGFGHSRERDGTGSSPSCRCVIL